MKIAMISGEFPPMPGGVGDFTRILSEDLRDCGHDISMLSRAGTASASLPLSIVDGWSLRGMRQIRAWLRRVNPDIINLQFQTAAFDMSPWIHFLPGFSRAPVVTTFHDLRFPYLFPKAGPLRDWIVMRLARSSAGVITTNHEDDSRLRALPKRRLIPIGSSINRQSFDPEGRSTRRKQLGANDDTFLLGHFGFVKAIKGVHHLIEALAQLRKDGQEVRLVFIGGRSNTIDSSEDQRYLRDLAERIRRLDLEKAVRWTGFLTEAEVAEHFNAIDLMVLPFTDGASYRRSSLIAAIHQGCAILTTKPTIDIDTFIHKQNLWLVGHQSSESIQIALAHLMSYPEQLRTLSAGAVELSKHFDWNVIRDETLALYESCL